MPIAAALLLAGVTVVLPPEATITGASIRLGDVAVVRSDDAAEAARFADFDLGFAPSPGFSRLLEDRWIGDRLHAAWPEVTIEFHGARAVRVWPRVERVSGEA
ncbi:MAG TPA: hypothetical protein VJP77_07230, partial [Planctomycetota bacterium]|nr:hypothetical protein [Planctomycetota bacterium]